MVSLGGRTSASVSMELGETACSGQEAASLTKIPFVASKKDCPEHSKAVVKTVLQRHLLSFNSKCS